MAEQPSSQGRRGFLNWFLGTSVGALAATVVYPVARFLSPPQIAEATTRQVEAGLTNDPELLENGFKIIRFGSDPVILVRTPDNEFRAFGATCTHLDCIVSYRPDRNLMWCFCHDGQFDLTGRNVGGPPPHSLTAYTVHQVANGGGQADTLVVEKA